MTPLNSSLEQSSNKFNEKSRSPVIKNLKKQADKSEKPAPYLTQSIPTEMMRFHLDNNRKKLELF